MEKIFPMIKKKIEHIIQDNLKIIYIMEKELNIIVIIKYNMKGKYEGNGRLNYEDGTYLLGNLKMDLGMGKERN